MTVECPIYEKGQGTQMIETAEKMGMQYKLVQKRRKIVAILIEYDDPMELIYFGMTLVGDMTGMFRGPLTR